MVGRMYDDATFTSHAKFGPYVERCHALENAAAIGESFGKVLPLPAFAGFMKDNMPASA